MNPNRGESLIKLDKVRAILRYQQHEELVSLLLHAQADWELYDLGMNPSSEQLIQIVTAKIYAPIDDCTKLRNLSSDDRGIILNAIQEVFGTDEDMYVRFVNFMIDTRTLDPLTSWSPTGWERIDQELRDVERKLGDSTTPHNFQSVSADCRNLLITLAETVFDPDSHPKVDSNEPDASKNDAKRMLDRYFSAELPGSTNKQYRRLAKQLSDNAWGVANATLHDRNNTRRRALLCVEATKSLINVVAIVAGKRDIAADDTDGASSY